MHCARFCPSPLAGGDAVHWMQPRKNGGQLGRSTGHALPNYCCNLPSDGVANSLCSPVRHPVVTSVSSEFAARDSS